MISVANPGGTAKRERAEARAMERQESPPPPVSKAVSKAVSKRVLKPASRELWKKKVRLSGFEETRVVR